MKKRTTYSTHVKVLLTILVTALLLIEISASEHHVIAQAELTDEELADTLVMETVAALGWDQTPDEDSAFSSVFELEHYLTNANATYFVAGGNVFYYYALVSVFPTDEDAEAYLQQVLNHEAMTKQVLWSGPDEDWETWWWSRDSQPATFHGINAVQAHHQGYEPSQGPYFLGWPMRNFFIGCFETPSTNSGGYKLGCTEFLYQTALNYGLGIELSPNPEPPDLNPNPEPNPNPDPNPDPGPIEIDSETLRILQSILGTPIIPITGAVAGGLIAWVLSMLGGGRPVLPTPPRPPTGGVRPGQAGPDGKILSPTGQGWVSKSIYDYQQKWLQKGWRWNSQTGKFEGQHGAVNENGQVQDDELGWVDQKTFQDNEQMRSQGYVYDRSMGWQTPEDSNRFKSDWDGMRQRERERSADKNAQIQSELKESQAQRDQAFQQKMQKIDAQRAGEIKANMEMYQKRAQKYVNWDKNLEYATYVAQTIETAADVGIAVCARLTGPAGKAIAAAYETAKEVAVTADDVLASDDVVGKAKELGDDKIKDEYKDKIKEKIEEKVTPYIPKFVNRIANQIKRPIKKFILRRTGKTGLIIYQEAEKKLLEYGKEQVEEFVEGQVETAVEEIKNNIDPNLLTGA